MKLLWLPNRIVMPGLLSVLLCTGCGGSSTEPSPNPATTTAGSNKERNLAPVAAQSTKLSVVNGSNALGLDLLRKVEDNTVVAPFTASLSLARLRAGAKGATRSAINGIMHLDDSAIDVDAAFNDLALGVNSRIVAASLDNQASQAQAGAWAQLRYGYQRTYLDTLAESYGLKPLRLDFARSLDDAVGAISTWDSQASPGLSTSVAASNDTRLVLEDAVNLNGAWAEPFAPALTATGSFQPLAADAVEAPFMHQSATLPQTSGDGYLAVALPLNGGQQFLLVLPDSERFWEILTGLTAEKLAEIAGALTPAPVDLALPKFAIRSTFPMDIGDVAGGPANYSGIDGTTELNVTSSTHDTRLSIAEAGLQAGSITRLVLDDFRPETWNNHEGGIIVSTDTPNPTPPAVVGFGRPFIFAVRDTDTGAVLFLGRVMNPTL